MNAPQPPIVPKPGAIPPPQQRAGAALQAVLDRVNKPAGLAQPAFKPVIGSEG